MCRLKTCNISEINSLALTFDLFGLQEYVVLQLKTNFAGIPIVSSMKAYFRSFRYQSPTYDKLPFQNSTMHPSAYTNIGNSRPNRW